MDENVTFYENIKVERHLGRQKASVFVGNGVNEMVELPTGVWNYGALVSALVRVKYSEDEVEAIINNNIALIAMPSAVSDEEGQQKLSEFQEMQEWREKCKARAKELMTMGEEMGLEECYG